MYPSLVHPDARVRQSIWTQVKAGVRCTGFLSTGSSLTDLCTSMFLTEMGMGVTKMHILSCVSQFLSRLVRSRAQSHLQYHIFSATDDSTIESLLVA